MKTLAVVMHACGINKLLKYLVKTNKAPLILDGKDLVEDILYFDFFAVCREQG